MPEPITIFGQRAIMKTGMTARKMAELLEVHEVSLAKYKSGVVLPSLPMAREIAVLVGLPLDQLYFKAEARGKRKK